MTNSVLMSGIINVALGSYFIYLSRKNEKMAKLGKFPLILGILFIIYALINVIKGWD